VIAVDVAWELKIKGCGCLDKKVGAIRHKVQVRFLGLYDPVDMGVGMGNRDRYGGREVSDVWSKGGYRPGFIPSNVSYSARAIAGTFAPWWHSNPAISRSGWHRPAYDNATWTLPVTGTHSALGGAPTFDSKQDQLAPYYSHERDIQGAILADEFIRVHARSVGVPIESWGVKYDYDNMPPLK
jgi:hypothetical protein